MSRSEPENVDRLRWEWRKADWRAWLTLAWIAWFGVLYGKMVWQERGAKIVEIVSGSKR